VSGSQDRTIIIWDAKDGTKIGTLYGHKDWVTCIAFAPYSRQDNKY
jgi:WD40 repeat protein